MNQWILPHIHEEIAERNKIRQQQELTETQQNQLKEPVNYVILDAAVWDTHLNMAFSLSTAYTSLFATRGAEHDLDDVAPYLFAYTENSDFGKWLQSQKEGGLRALYLSSDTTLEGLRKHLRRFLRIKTESGKWLFFRFYDPHVAAITLPYLTEEQQRYFYHKIAYIQYDHRLTKEPTFLMPSIHVVDDIQTTQIKYYPTFIFDKKQLALINQERRDEFVTRLNYYIQSDPAYSHLYEPETYVSKALEDCSLYGIKKEADIYKYTTLYLTHSPHFDEEKLTTFLSDKTVDVNQKLDLLSIYLDQYKP